MKKNIVILSFISFLMSAALLYFFVEIIYTSRLSAERNISQETTISVIDIVSPEIKAAFMKSDDISLLYSIDRVSKLKNVSETFIMDNDMNILIHNDSSKWNKKYQDSIYKKAISAKSKLIQEIQSSHSVLYSIPVNETSVLCVVFSLQDVYNGFNVWKIKLYVYGFLISFLIMFVIYYLSKFLFYRPFSKAKKYLSLNNTSKKTIYSELINMASSVADDISDKADSVVKCNNRLKDLIVCVFKSYLRSSDDIFIILDSYAKLVYCVDEDKIVFDNQEPDSHIVKLTTNSELIKNISMLIENPDTVVNMDIESYKINITPVKNSKDEFVGIIIAGNARKDNF